MCSIYNENILFILYVIIWKKIYVDPRDFAFSFAITINDNLHVILVDLREKRSALKSIQQTKKWGNLHSIPWRLRVNKERGEKDLELRCPSSEQRTLGEVSISCPGNLWTSTSSPLFSQVCGISLGVITLPPLVPKAFRLWLDFTTSFPGSSTCRQHIVRILNLHKHMSEFP